MEVQKILSGFFSAIANDERISVTHIGVFAALLQYRIDHDFKNPIQAFSYEIMSIAKISACATYFKCVRDLSLYGYITYEPSFKCNRASKIYFSE